MKILITGNISEYSDLLNDIIKNSTEIGLKVQILKGEANHTIFAVKEAIKEVTGQEYADYCVRSRERKKYFARLIFAHYCFLNDMDVSEIASMLHRNKSNIKKYPKKFETEIKFNKAFKAIAQKVSSYIVKIS